MKPNSHLSTRNPQSAIRKVGAFTLVELLVVIAIIGILAGLITGLASIAASKKKFARVEAEKQQLITVIEFYKAKKGFYPPDYPNPASYSTIYCPLYYELTGTIVTNGNFRSTEGDILTPANVGAVFGGLGGFMNTAPSDTPGDVKNFIPNLKTGQIGRFTLSGVTFTLLGTPVAGPADLITTTGAKFNPWHYNSSHPAHNAGEFDLWMDIIIKGQTNRVSNWSKDPQLVNDYQP